jgi:hypothetical protein
MRSYGLAGASAGEEGCTYAVPVTPLRGLTVWLSYWECWLPGPGY